MTTDLTGHTIGYITFIRRVYSSRWLCRCECGKEFEARSQDIKRGQRKSCGCKFKHGHSNTRLYMKWHGIKQKCLNTYSEHYRKNCILYPEWKKFQAFYEWAIAAGYNDSMDIRRINTKDGFNPTNCIWVKHE